MGTKLDNKSSIVFNSLNGSVAQRLVHLLHTEQVGGSNPLTSTIDYFVVLLV